MRSGASGGTSAVMALAFAAALGSLGGCTVENPEYVVDAQAPLDRATAAPRMDFQFAAPTCSDGVRNGEETDVDCGGMGCMPCHLGAACMRDADCAGELCDSADKVCVS